MRRSIAVLALCLVDGLRPLMQRTRRPTSRHISNSPDLEEEARIRAKLEDHAAQQRGRHAKKKLSPAAQRRRAKRGASFEAAQDIGRELAEQLRDKKTLDDEARELLQDLVSTTSGARGWFVSLLTDDDLAQLFEPPIDDALLEPIAARPEPNLRLCVMNVAMSAATAVAHERDGHRDLAAASRATSSRSAALCTALLERDMMAGLAEALRALYEAAAPRDDDLGELGEILGLSSDAAPSHVDEDWAAFLDKWRYGPDQRAAIRQTLYDNWAPVVVEPE
jgi:hypothetical protein